MGLPDLEFISFGSMGKVLSEDSFDGDKFKGVAKKRRMTSATATKLKLTHFNEMDPTFMNIRHLELICPFTRHISLSMPISVYNAIDDNENVIAVDILRGNATRVLLNLSKFLKSF